MSSHAAAGTIDHHHDPTTTTGIPNKKLLWWAFLASDCMFFGALIASHLVYRINPPPGNATPTQIFSIPLTSFSTFILLMSSLLMAIAVNDIQRGAVKGMRLMLLGTIFFGCIFLGGQVYEFTHFVLDKQLTISNSIFGSTFYTLTGTHGTHVAVGVLLLGLMYVRSFKPANAGAPSLAWMLKSTLHLLAFAVAAGLTFIKLVPAIIHWVSSAEPLPLFLSHHGLTLLGAAIAYAVLGWFARSYPPTDFGEVNAIDVESIGLYWHFVDIVWIVIFTVVYLLEYI